MSDKILSFGFTLDEINVILAGLDQLPHGRVRSLIDKVQIQAAPQLSALESTEPTESFDEAAAE